MPSSASLRPAPSSKSHSGTTLATDLLSQTLKPSNVCPTSSSQEPNHPDRHGFCPSYTFTSPPPGPSFWSRTISTSTARLPFMKRSRPPKPADWSSASNGTTRQNTAAGSIWRSPNSASFRLNASTAASPTNKPSSTKSKPGSTIAMPNTPRPIGTSQPQTPVSNSNTYTRQSN